MSDILEVQDVSINFGGHRAVDGATFSVEQGSITSLIGPNGAGKTTVFNLICGILETQTGDVRFDGQSIRGLKPFQIARSGLGRTFQDPRIYPEMSVLDNVIVGVRQRGELIWPALLRDRAMKAQLRDARARAESTLETFGLGGRMHEPGRSLSFGEQRFLSIARTLVSAPKLVLMDEPTVGLDQMGLAKLSGLMTEIASRTGTTFLVIEHNMEVVMAMSRKIVLLVAGRVEASDTPDKVRSHRNMVEAYLGRKHAA